jgi:Sec-independent protein translocase protein TatA
MSFNFSEILLILLVALLVIKPERLPAAAATLGRCLKWLRQLSANLKREIEAPLEKLTHDSASQSTDESRHQ